jgi:NTP pyrophosphatase (non-canonical NTP hydrolase)
VDVAEVQRTVDGWVADNGGYWDEMSLLARLVEEVGELAREYNHRFGRKKKRTTEGDRELRAEMGDLLFILVCMANQQGIDLDSALGETLEKYRSRDSERWKP